MMIIGQTSLLAPPILPYLVRDLLYKVKSGKASILISIICRPQTGPPFCDWLIDDM